jgi:hypothetical protein
MKFLGNPQLPPGIGLEIDAGVPTAVTDRLYRIGDDLYFGNERLGSEEVEILCTQTSHGFTAGKALYLDGTVYALAKADTMATSDAVGIVSSVINDHQFRLITSGKISCFSGLTPGMRYYLSDTVAGGLTTTEPTISKPMLVADTATSGYVFISRAVVKPGLPLGAATLDAGGHVPTSQLPPTLGGVSSFNGLTGAVSVTTSDIPEGSNYYFTNARVIATPLTGLVNNVGGAITSTDTIVAAFGKHEYRLNALVTGVSSVNGFTGAVNISTSNVAEGSNLYWTQGRFDVAFATAWGLKSTTNLPEGTNLYWTQTRFDNAFTAKSTTNLSEGLNLYFTNARAVAAPLGGLNVSSGGTVVATDTVLQAIGKLEYRTALNDAKMSYPGGTKVDSFNTRTGAVTLSSADVTGALTYTPANKAGDIMGPTTFTGQVTTSNVDSAAAGTLNLGATNAQTVNIGTAATTQIINVGTGSGVTTINLGGAGDTVNIAGTLVSVNTTNTNVTDTLITLNKGGAAASGGMSGIEIEEGGVITGYAKTSSSRLAWAFHAPASAGTITLTPSTAGSIANITAGAAGSHTYTLPDVDGTFLTTGNMGAGSGLDADLLDGQSGSYYLLTTNFTEGTNLFFTNARAIAAPLTGFSAVSGGAVAATDSILAALQKHEYRLGSLVTGVASVNGFAGTVVLTSTNINEGTNLYFTSARVLSQVLTGFSAASGGSVSAGDSVLSAFGKLENRMALNDAKISYPGAPSWSQVTSKPTTLAGYSITATDVTGQILTNMVTTTGGAIATTDTILIALGKLENRTALNDLKVTYPGPPSWAQVTSKPTTLSGYGVAAADVTGQLLAGFSATAGTAITASDSILTGLQKHEYRLNSLVTGVSSVNTFTGAVVLTTSNIAEGTNLYFTNARGIASTLTGFTAAAGGTVTASDTIIAALQKLEYRTAINDAKTAYPGGTKVDSFNGRSGVVTLSYADAIAAIGYTPANKAGDTFTGPVVLSSLDSDAAGTIDIGATAATVNVGVSADAGTINIGTGAGTTVINIGGAGDTVNINGTLTTVNTTNTAVVDKVVTLNKGGGSATGDASGIEIEEGGAITGSAVIGNSRQSWMFRAPARGGAFALTVPSAYTLELLATLTANRSISFPDATGTVWTSGNMGTGSTLDADLLDGQQGSYYLLTTNMSEGTKLFFTNARAIAAPLTGLTTAMGGALTATDTILAAFGKLENRMAVNDLKVSYPGAPSWAQITSKPTTLTGFGITDAAAIGQTFYIGTTPVAINRTSGALSLTGVSIDGSAATVTAAAQPSITSVGTLTQLDVGTAGVRTSTLTTNSVTANQVLFNVPQATFRSAEFIITGVDTTGAKFQSTKILAIHGGSTNADYTEYGSVQVGGVVGTFSVVADGTNLKLQVTPASSNSTTFKVTAILTTV